jgi:glycosyltransferase involved in cell wall biosynthesis
LQVELICRKDPVLDTWVTGIVALGVRVHRINLTRPGDYAAVLRLMRASDLVHLVLAYPTGKYQLTAALLARAARRPLIVTHQLVVDVRDIAMPSMRSAFWRRAFRLYARLARTNIATSRAGRELLTRRYQFPEASTVLIYNGADLELFRPLTGAERSSVRQSIAADLSENFPPPRAGDGTKASPPPLAGEGRVGASSDDVLLSCTVARLTPQKGLLDLIEAAAQVVPRLPNVRFVLAGDGELRAQLEARVAALGLTRQVRFAGSRPLAVLARWLGAADLFLLSSHYEGMPLAMIEAMAAGCPVVATAVGGVPDVVDDSNAGRVVPAKDPHALAAAIIEILGDPDKRRTMAAAARQRAITAFDVRTCYQKTVETYQ